MSDRTCEVLERRRLLAATLDSNGHLAINGTPGNDVIGVAIRLTKLRVQIGATLTQFNAADVKSIAIDLGDGADHLSLGGGLGAVYMLGGLGDDTIFAGDGNDTVTAGGGKDLVFGGPGDDRLDGGPTADRIYGDDGADRIYGGDANDYLEGVAGVDRLFAGLGNDYLVGGSSNDKLYGDEGADTLFGGNQSDLLTGGAGDDEIHGNDGDDTITGQDGDDNLFGDKNNDQIYGDAGFDSLDGGSGNDQLFGLADDDLLHGNADADTLDGGDGADDLRGDAGLDSLIGGNGNDGLFGGFDADTLTGSAGADRILQRRKSTDDAWTDRAAEDAVIAFADGDRIWTDAEIDEVDVGMAWLHEKTNNTKLLKRADGKDIILLRRQFLGTNVLADNPGDGTIRFADLTFELGEAAGTMVHEYGHFWDTEGENPNFRDFAEISKWRERGGVWIYTDLSSQFASEYGKTNPFEDFATSFETYFTGFRNKSLWLPKWTFIDNFIKSITTA